MLVTAMALAPKLVLKLAAAVEDFTPHVGPGEGKLQEELCSLLDGLTAAVEGFTYSSPSTPEGKPILIDLAGTVDLCWGTLAQAVEEWDTTSPEGQALLRLFNAAEGAS